MKELAGDADSRNPQTGQPWGLATIKRDLQGLEAQWRKEALCNISILKGEQLAALREVRGAGWNAGDLTAVLQALKAEITLCGTQTPKKVARTNARGEDWRSPADAREELARILGVEPEQLPESE